MRSVNVPLSEDTILQLAELAEREFRGPRQQAALLVVEGLRRAGADATVAAVEPPLIGDTDRIPRARSIRAARSPGRA